MNTERPSPRYSEIDSWEPGDALDAMIEGQFAAVAAVHAARLALERAALAIEERLRAGGRLVYAGAGTSGRLAVQDGAELMPTFSWPRERLVLIMAGGAPAFTQSVEGAEDQTDTGAQQVREHRVDSKDVLIAVAASGTTPFTFAALKEAKRLGALMVDVQATNEKLMRRSEDMVMRLSGGTREQARSALGRAQGSVKLAILLSRGCDLKTAKTLLDRGNGQLRKALALIGRGVNAA
jgi:N-acetylmuramic acid 6-phosphate etherase